MRVFRPWLPWKRVHRTRWLFWLRLWRFYFRDEGDVYDSDAVTTGGENDEGAAVGSQMSEISRRNFARPAVGKADAEGPEGAGLQVFFDGFFCHGRFFFCPRRGSVMIQCYHRKGACQGLKWV